MTRKGTTIVPAEAEGDNNRERGGGEIYLYEEGVKVQSSSSASPVAAESNSFEALMGGWYSGMNNGGGGGGDIFMGMGLPGGGFGGGSSDMEAW